MRRPRYSPYAVLLGLALSACTDLAPPYAKPDPAVPVHAAAAVTSRVNKVDELHWQNFITTPRLRDTVALALANNRDLRIAMLNIEAARAQYRIQEAASLPNLSATAGVNSTSSGAFRSTAYTANLGLTLVELDFFGHLKNLQASAQQNYLATLEARRQAQIILVAEVANAWLTLAADQAQFALAQDTLNTYQRSHQLNRQKHELGAITGLALAQSQTAVDGARIDVLGIQTQLTQDRDALELLLGTGLPTELEPATDLSTPAALVDVPAGVSSELLQRRPDVLAAEHQLQASYAGIGVARAARFPSIALTASGGTASSSLSGLFKSGSSSWSFGPTVSVPIFDGGAGAANVKAAEVARDIALAQYDKAIQSAFQEVADALAVRATLAERLAAQQSLNASTRLQLELAEAQFRVGGATMLDVLGAQRALYSAEQSTLTLKQTEQANRITLYKVLGGGWQ